MNVFNNREIAIGIWLSLLIVWGVVNPSLRTPFHGLVKAFTRKWILIPLGLMAVYITFLVFGLHEAGLWGTGQLKNTIVWSVSVAAVSLLRTNRIKDDPNNIRNVIRDNLKLVVVLEFIVSFYTFDLWAELLIVPFSTALVIMLAMAESEKKYEVVEKLLNIVMALLGGGLIANAVYSLILDFDSFANTDTLVEFSFSPLLSLLFLPFLFILSIYMDYEKAFLRMQFGIKDSSLRAFAKRRAMFGFHVYTGLLKRWARNLMIMRPENKQDIKESIREVKVLKARERNPGDVPYERGWSPYVAAEYLTTEGLHPDDYHRAVAGGSQWCAGSPYLETGGGIIPSNIAFYVEGDEFTATALKLVMNVNVPQAYQEDPQKFTAIARLLFAKALHKEMPDEIENHILIGTDQIAHLHGKEVAVSKELWSEHHSGGYTLEFIIQNSAMPGLCASG